MKILSLLTILVLTGCNSSPAQQAHDAYNECAILSKDCHAVIGQQYLECVLDVDKIAVCQKIYLEQMAVIEKLCTQEPLK